MSHLSLLPRELHEAPVWVQELYESFDPLVTYQALSKKSTLAQSTLANRCCQGSGPPGGIFLGKKKVFPRLEVALWLWNLAQGNKF